MKKIVTDKILSEVALGGVIPDTIIRNGTLFNVFTGEFIGGQSIWIKGGRIAYVGPDHDLEGGEKAAVIDIEGMVMLPGLIESHTHLNRSGIEEYVKHVIPSGVTTVVMETIDFGMIAGREGMDYFVNGLKGQPIRFYYTVPPLCGLIPSVEVNAPSIEDLLPLLEAPECLGVGEIYWSNLFLRGRQGKRVRELAFNALRLGKRVEGHTAGATGRKLQAYTCFGISSCHEPINENEVLERLRLGYWVMIRQGAIRKELPGVKGIFTKKIDSRRLILSTDGMDPEGFVKEGYLDAAVRSTLHLGAHPDLAYQMVTINAAEHFHLDHLIGSLSPGKMADIVIIPSPDQFSPQMVMCAGKVIFKDKRVLVEPKKAFFPEHLFDTVKIGGYRLSPLPRRGRVRVMELVTGLVTKERIIGLDNPEEMKDVLMLLALDRVGGKRVFHGLLKGFGLQKGAYGSTACWDTIDLIAVGCDLQSMRTVIERLKEIRGGMVYAIEGKVVAESSAPLVGVMSLKPMESLREEIRKVEDSLRRNGAKWEKPTLTIDTLTSPAIPHLRITHEGYVRLRDREVLSLEVVP